ncbi:intermembrane phospholipid transport protein YdbH family protein [Pseudoalteromonas denitrificans]|uniref:Dicarboxylate transport n=1 Tax=Pseudoalteromonas denitrificans DSM 6059 TaxID=1123010 RepID=A0A1I1LES3_9GAMM|nr:YdbH domain-containing protein [Pseudoalteromonas denitrificans]SFC71604.1 Dicarboxylate transport [Pseudoalteromonas denitrificans DSM 6059]
MEPWVKLYMRLLKLSCLVLVIFSLITSTLYFYRNAFLVHFSKAYLAKFDMSITCIDTRFTSNLDLTFDKLCLDHPLVNVDITNAQVNWSYYSGFSLDEISLNKLKFESKDSLISKKSSNQTSFRLQDIHQMLRKITALSLPIPIKIDQFTYQGFNSGKIYKGEFSVKRNVYTLQFYDVTNTEIALVNLNVIDKKLAGKFTLNLTPMLDFLDDELFKLPSEIKEKVDIKGKISSEFEWEPNQLNIIKQTEKIHLISSKGIYNSGPFKLEHDLTYSALIDENIIDVLLEKGSQLAAQYSHAALVRFFKNKGIDPRVIALLNDNVNKNMRLQPSGKLKVNFSKQKISLTKLAINNLDEKQPILLHFNSLFTRFDIKNAQAQFDLNAHVRVFKDVTNVPVKLITKGEIIKNDNLSFRFEPDSQVKLTDLTFKGKNNSTTPTHMAYIGSMVFDWQGNIVVDKNKDVKLAVKLKTKMDKGIVKNIVKTKSIQMASQINGSLNDIKINGQLMLDDIPLAEFDLSGNVSEPHIEILADNLSLNALLGLNIQKTLPISVINGSLDYHLKGQVKNWQSIDANQFNLSVKISDVIGEINDTWFEGFNWQQKFIFEQGNIKTSDNYSALSLASLDVGTPITNLIAKSIVAFSNETWHFSLVDFKGDMFGGSFHIPAFQWPIDSKKAMNINLIGIDLNKLVELEKQQGVLVTGKVSGEFPFYINNNNNATIVNGKLYNVSNGVIQLKDNPAVTSLKQSSTELALAFDALQNLHYHKLSASVYMYEDGRMLLDTAIKGRNPDLDNDVNLNLNLNYDLLGLIKSLRIADNVESDIIQKLQQN